MFRTKVNMFLKNLSSITEDLEVLKAEIIESCKSFSTHPGKRNLYIMTERDLQYIIGLIEDIHHIKSDFNPNLERVFNLNFDYEHNWFTDSKESEIKKAKNALLNQKISAQYATIIDDINQNIWNNAAIGTTPVYQNYQHSGPISINEFLQTSDQSP